MCWLFIIQGIIATVSQFVTGHSKIIRISKELQILSDHELDIPFAPHSTRSIKDYPIFLRVIKLRQLQHQQTLSPFYQCLEVINAESQTLLRHIKSHHFDLFELPSKMLSTKSNCLHSVGSADSPNLLGSINDSLVSTPSLIAESSSLLPPTFPSPLNFYDSAHRPFEIILKLLRRIFQHISRILPT